MADLSSITLPNNTTYNIKDGTARSELTQKENSSNKVTSISSSSTNTQYPSALAVYNYVNSAIVNAIEGSY